LDTDRHTGTVGPNDLPGPLKHQRKGFYPKVCQHYRKTGWWWLDQHTANN